MTIECFYHSHVWFPKIDYYFCNLRHIFVLIHAMSLLSSNIVYISAWGASAMLLKSSWNPVSHTLVRWWYEHMWSYGQQISPDIFFHHISHTMAGAWQFGHCAWKLNVLVNSFVLSPLQPADVQWALMSALDGSECIVMQITHRTACLIKFIIIYSHHMVGGIKQCCDLSVSPILWFCPVC